MRVAVAIAVLSLLCSTPAFAQVHRTFWGVTASVTPKWQAPTAFKDFFDAEEMKVEGGEFQIGFVRGSIPGGDWGVSYIRKTISDDSIVVRPAPLPACPTCGAVFDQPDSWMNGVEIHKFASFGTIKQRVQIGMNFAGGVATVKGTVRATTVTPAGTTTETVDAKFLFEPWGHEMPVVPLGKIEAAVAVIVTPDVKIRMSGGFDFPGYNKFTATVVYLFGAR